MSIPFGAARFGSWALQLWPVPLVVATALIAMLVAQRFGVNVGLPTDGDTTAKTLNVSIVQANADEPGG